MDSSHPDHRACLQAKASLDKERTVALLPKAAEYVVAELLAVIDIDQDWKGWAHEYRKDFQYNGHEFRTLAEALTVLRDGIKYSR